MSLLRVVQSEIEPSAQFRLELTDLMAVQFQIACGALRKLQDIGAITPMRDYQRAAGVHRLAVLLPIDQTFLAEAEYASPTPSKF